VVRVHPPAIAVGALRDRVRRARHQLSHGGRRGPSGACRGHGDHCGPGGIFGGLRQIFDQRGRYVLAAEAWGGCIPLSNATDSYLGANGILARVANCWSESRPSWTPRSPHGVRTFARRALWKVSVSLRSQVADLGVQEPIEPASWPFCVSQLAAASAR
jgi:hypothetical protein